MWTDISQKYKSLVFVYRHFSEIQITCVCVQTFLRNTNHLCLCTDISQKYKAAVTKNQQRRKDFHAKELQTPPQPILTRWGSWIEAAGFYAENYESVKEVVNSWDGNGVLVLNAQKAVNSDSLFMSLVELERYKQIPCIIKKLENPASNIMECYKYVNDFLQELDVDDPVKIYLSQRLQKSGDLLKIISGENVGNPAVLAQIRTSLGSSADVERTFSKLNKMLANDRNFDVTNIENYICIYCNISL